MVRADVLLLMAPRRYSNRARLHPASAREDGDEDEMWDDDVGDGAGAGMMRGREPG